MIVGDSLGAVPVKESNPATTASAAPKTTGGSKVKSSATPKQALWLSAGYVVIAVATLLLGSRALRDARIG